MPDPPEEQSFTRHEVYYQNQAENLFVLEVDGYLYRIPSSPFSRASSWWSDMLHARSVGEKGEGDSDDSPIHVPLPESLTRVDFERLLAVLFPMFDNADSQPSLSDSPLSAWTSVLKLATAWEMDGVRRLAIANIGILPAYIALSGIDKTVLALHPLVSVQEWLLCGCLEVIKHSFKQTPAVLILHRIPNEQVRLAIQLQRWRLNGTPYQSTITTTESHDSKRINIDQLWATTSTKVFSEAEIRQNFIIDLRSVLSLLSKEVQLNLVDLREGYEVIEYPVVTSFTNPKKPTPNTVCIQ